MDRVELFASSGAPRSGKPRRSNHYFQVGSGDKRPDRRSAAVAAASRRKFAGIIGFRRRSPGELSSCVVVHCARGVEASFRGETATLCQLSIWFGQPPNERPLIFLSFFFLGFHLCK
ncbi:hypothetical protein PanWU01x14_015890, partial [Parasponia andersonii]